jgi:aqualysin 1
MTPTRLAPPDRTHDKPTHRVEGRTPVKIRTTLVLLALLLIPLIQIRLAGQPSANPFIVVFHDDGPFSSFPRGQADARARANPAAWSYLNASVIGAVQTLERQHGFRANQVYSATVRGFAARLTNAQVQALERDPLVAYVEPDVLVQPFEQILPWGVDHIEADHSSALSGDGSGSITNVNVYILDVGVDQTHPDLNVIGHVNFTADANVANCSHGTRAAGDLAARDNDIDVVGVLPGAPITAVKVLPCDPVFIFASAVIKGVDWTRANAVKPAVANMSLGGPNNKTLDTAVKRLADSGVPVAIAAGNSSTPACWTSPQRAGTHAGVIVVAATDDTNHEASFSSFGQCVDIWAPGTHVQTTELGGGIVTVTGTSYASPHVTGTAGLYLSQHTSASAAEVENALKSSAKFFGTFSKDFRLVKIVYAGGY